MSNKADAEISKNNLDKIIGDLGEPSNGRSINSFRELLDAAISYYDFRLKEERESIAWNQKRKIIEKIRRNTIKLKKTIEDPLSEQAESSLQLGRARLMVKKQIVSSDRTLLLPITESVAWLALLEKICDNAIESSGRKRNVRPKMISLKVRMVCYMAYLYYYFFIHKSTKKKPPQISFQPKSKFYKLISEIFRENKDMRYSIAKAKKLFKKYRNGKDRWWVENVDEINYSSLVYVNCLEKGIEFDGDRDNLFVYCKKTKKLKYII